VSSVRGLAVLGTAAVAVLLAAPEAAAQTSPNVSVTLTDGKAEVSAGDRLEYRVALRNKAATDATVDVELALPVGAFATEVTDGERLEPWLAAWQPTVAAGSRVTLSATFTAGKPRQEAKGYTAQVCLVHDHIREACATDINQLPGTADIHALGTAEETAGWRTWLAAVTAAAATSILAATLLVRRRREPRSSRRRRRLQGARLASDEDD
jgi:hypothetical protein